ncbi:MAG TPA: trypsin-like serine protease [Polyangiaceae bacterium]|nr:trypsin-like serine protease [Polyangiaceae bacterium]
MKTKGAVLVVSGLVVLACSAEDGAPDGNVSGNVAAPSSGEIPPPPYEFVDQQGRHFIRVGPAPMAQPGELAALPPAAGEAESEYQLPDTVEEFAEDIRAVRYMAGYEYLESEPPMEKAENLFNHFKYGAEDKGPQRSEPSGPAPEERVARALAPSRMLDSSTDYPARTSVFNSFTNGDGSPSGCSGTMISRGTMVTAAHCLYDTTANVWRSMTFWPGENQEHSVSGSRNPYGSVTCFTVAVPQAWKDFSTSANGVARHVDYGSVDFNGYVLAGAMWVPCEKATGDDSGWLGWWIITSAELAARSTAMRSYPGCIGTSTYCAQPGHLEYVNGGANMFTQSASAGQTWISTDSKVQGTYTLGMLGSQMDMIDGSSGGGVYAKDGDYPYLIGTVRGRAPNGENQFKQFDPAVRDFVSSSSDYITSSDTWGPASDPVLTCSSLVPGSGEFCVPGCPCTNNEGDCDEYESDCSDSDVWCPSVDCAPGLVCANNKGPAYGQVSTNDVCMKQTCAERTLGGSGYCSSGCKCGHGGGDCNPEEDDCLPGFHCGTNNGAAFGFSSSTDVCVPD